MPRRPRRELWTPVPRPSGRDSLGRSPLSWLRSNKARLLLTWILSLSFVAYILSTLDLAQVAHAFARAQVVPLAIALLVGAWVVFVGDSLTLRLLFNRFVGRTPLREVLSVKGASYFLNAINYNAAAGGMALFISKKREAPFLQALSALLWLNFVDVLVLTVMAGVGLWLGHDLVPEEHRRVLAWVVLGAAGVSVGALAYWQLGWDFFVLGRLRSWRVFAAFRRARGADYLAMMGARGAFILLYVVLALVTLPTFDIHVGFLSLLLYVPILTFVQIVPVQVSGLGAIQELMIAFYGPYAGAMVADPRAQVFAWTLVIGPVMVLIRLGIGYLFVGGVAHDFFPKDPLPPLTQATTARDAEP